MPLQTQTLEVGIATGLNSKVDAKHTFNLVTAQNAVFQKSGAVQKRNGFTALARGSHLTTGAKMFGYQNRVCVIDGSDLWTYSPGAQAWTDHGPVPECTATRATVWAGPTPSLTEGVADPDVVYAFGMLYILWLDGSGNLQVLVEDAVTGALFSGPSTLAANVQQWRALLVNGVPMVLYASNSTGTTIQTVYWTSAGTGVHGGTVPTVTLGSASSAFDAVFTAQARLLVAVDNGTNLQTSAFAASAGVLSYLSTGTTSAGTSWNAIGICDGTGCSYVVGAKGTAGSCTVTSAKVNQTSGATVTSYGSSTSTDASWVASPGTVGIVETSGGAGFVSIVVGNAEYPSGAMWTCTAGTYAAPSGAFGPLPLSRPFLRVSKVYIYVRIAPAVTVPQSSDLLLDVSLGYTYNPGAFSTSRIVATLAPRLSGNLFSMQGTPHTALSHVPTVDFSGNVYGVATYIIPSAGPKVRVGLSVSRLNFNDPNRWQTAELNGQLHIAGGLPSVFDGANTFEAGFVQQPSTPTLATNTSGGGLAAGTYTLFTVFEQVDACGVTHQSTPSPTAQITTTGTTSTITVSQPGLQASNRANVRIVVYVTSPTGGVGTFYRYSGLTGLTGTPFTGNGSQAVSISVTTVDTTAATFTLTISGGAVPNTNPPAATCIVAHRGSLWLAGTDDGATAWYSTPETQLVAMNFDDAFTVIFDDAPITALASQDATLITFSKRRIFATSGDVPTANGQNGTLTTVQVQSDTGAVSPLSVVRSPAGTWFQSVQGLYLLDRSLNVSYMGQNVEDQIDANPFISAATLVDTEGQIRWNTSVAQSSATTQQVVYDYVQNAWSTWNVQTGHAIVSSALVAGVFYYLDSSGLVVFEDATTALDVGTYVPLTLTTGWWKPDVLQGFQRIRRLMVLGQALEAHQLTVSWAVDYAPAVVSSRTFVQASAGVEQWEAHIDRQKSQAFQITVTDSAPTTGIVAVGLGFTLSSLMLEVGTKRGVNKLPATARS